MSEDILREMIAERLKELSANAYAVEMANNLPADAVRSILRGGKKSGTSLNRVKEVCDALGLELYIGPPREVTPTPSVSLEANEYAQIPLHDASLGAGGGAENQNEEIIDHLAFRRDWLTRHGISASAAVLARVSGNSMARTISEGDMVMIDTSKRQLRVNKKSSKRPAAIYALLDDGNARVKRLIRTEGDLVILHSDNPEYPVEHRPLADLEIIGKVVWWGHTVRE